MLRDQVIGMGVGKVETRASTPVTQESALDVVLLEGFPEKGVTTEEDLSLAKFQVLNIP
jgi:hypothetical protein